MGERVYEKQDPGPLTLLAEGCGLGPPSLTARGKAAAHRAPRLRFLELKANCVSSCQPQEERHKHHLSAGACRGRLLRASSEGLKWKWPRLPVPGTRCCLAGLAVRVPGRSGEQEGLRLKGLQARRGGRDACFLSVCMCANVCLCEYRCQQRPEENSRYFGAGLPGYFE